MASVGLVRRGVCASVLAISIGWAMGGGAAQAGTTQYTYDSLGRLIGTSNTATGTSVTYSYDAAGNRTQQVVVVQPNAQAVSLSVNQNTTNNPVPLNITGPAPSSIAVPSGPSHGTYAISGTAITYTPTFGYVGSDSFTYTATLGAWTSQPATVSITVLAIAPVAGGVTQTVAANSQYNPINTTNVNLTSVITGGTPTALQVAGAPSHGTVTISGLTMQYTPANGYSGPDSFTYTASNSAGTSAPATVSLTVSFGIAIWGQFTWGAGTW